MFRNALLLAVLALLGCSATGGADEDAVDAARPAAASGSGPAEAEDPGRARPLSIATYGPGAASMLARLEMVFAQENGCLVGRVGADIVLPVFRSGSIDILPDGRILYDGRRYSLGDAVTLGGGTAPTSGPQPPGLDLKGCRAGSIFLVG